MTSSVAAIENEQKRIDEEYYKAQAAYETTVSNKEQARKLSISGIGLALGGFVLLGLILAVLAIERHTRLLEDQRREIPEATVRIPVVAPGV